MYKDEQEVNASTLNSTVMSATENITDSGQCGDNLTWTLENGILTISGTGDMWDYEAIYDSESKTYITDTPWSAYKDSFHTLIIEENVTSIGNNAFRNCSGLVGQVTIPQGVTHIGNAAF